MHEVEDEVYKLWPKYMHGQCIYACTYAFVEIVEAPRHPHVGWPNRHKSKLVRLAAGVNMVLVRIRIRTRLVS